MADVGNTINDPNQTMQVPPDSQDQAPAPIQAVQPQPSTPAPPDVSNLPPRPGPQPIQQQPQPAPHPKAAMMGHLASAVFGILAGNPTQRFDPNTNQIVPNQLSTAQKFENMAHGFIRGAAAGATQVGPGSKGRSAVAGMQAVDAEKEMQDKALLEKASYAKSALDTARLGWTFAEQKKQLSEASKNQYDALDNLLSDDPRNQDLGMFKTFADFLASHPEMQAAGNDGSKLAAQGLIVNTIPSDDKGVAQGVHIFKIDPGWRDSQQESPYQYRQYTGNGQYQQHEIINTTNGRIAQLLMSNGFGFLGAPPSTGPKDHNEAVSWVSTPASEDQRAAGQRYLDTENKLAKGDALQKLENVPSMLARENAAAAIPQLQNMLGTETDPDRRVRINRLLATAQAAHQGYTRDLQSEANAKQLASQGSPADAGRLLANGSLTLADLKTRGLTPAFILQATNSAQRINPSYNPADETVAENVAKSASANQFFGSANSLIQKGGTLDQLGVIGAKIPQNKIPALNTVEDWTQVARGKGPLSGYAATILGVADDYGKVMGGGTASDSARNTALATIGAAQSPEQRAAAIESIRNSVISQADSRIGTNQFLRRQYGYALPQKQAPVPQVPVGATPILKGSQTVGYILNGQRTNF